MSGMVDDRTSSMTTEWFDMSMPDAKGGVDPGTMLGLYATKPYRLVGEITAAQYDRAVDLVRFALGRSDSEEVESLLLHEGDWRFVEHARWVLDRIDAGMLRVAEEPEAPA